MLEARVRAILKAEVQSPSEEFLQLMIGRLASEGFVLSRECCRRLISEAYPAVAGEKRPRPGAFLPCADDVPAGYYLG
jgi:hypothetical protein